MYPEQDPGSALPGDGSRDGLPAPQIPGCTAYWAYFSNGAGSACNLVVDLIEMQDPSWSGWNVINDVLHFNVSIPPGYYVYYDYIPVSQCARYITVQYRYQCGAGVTVRQSLYANYGPYGFLWNFKYIANVWPWPGPIEYVRGPGSSYCNVPFDEAGNCSAPPDSIIAIDAGTNSPPPEQSCSGPGYSEGIGLKLVEPIPLRNRPASAIPASGVTTWYLYPGACSGRTLGSWSPKAVPIADSLNGYLDGTRGGYCAVDRSLSETLWHVSDGTDAGAPQGQINPPISGARSLWCGKYDPNWALPTGYPNSTIQILYINTGSHAAPYTFSWVSSLASEFNSDYTYVIGGGDGVPDPIGNSRAILNEVIAGGASGNAEILETFTGVQQAPHTTYYSGYNTGPLVAGNSDPAAHPNVVTQTIVGIPPQHQAIYIVFVSDVIASHEDGGWSSGHGQILDLIATSDNGSIYNDQAPAGGVDAYMGSVLVGTPSSPIIAARVAWGVGELWQIATGSSLPTNDVCSPEKQMTTDQMFLSADANTHLTIPNTNASIVTCTFPLPPGGVASVFAQWKEYLDLPRGSGYVQYTEYRAFRDGSWSRWKNTRQGGGLSVGAPKAWVEDGDELSDATNADSVQIRFNIQCVNVLAVDHSNCAQLTYGILYDDFLLRVTTGVSKPAFGIFPGDLAQSTFVDGTDAMSVNCTGTQISAGACWPGVRGSGLSGNIAIHDNFNSPLGDSIVVGISSGLRRNGMGINWRQGFDKSVNSGLTIAHTNASYNSALDAPRVIFSLFDPATKTWSPFDSSDMDADNVSVSGGDTVVVNSLFRMNWPPRDKVASGATLPAGFTINGRSQYAQLAFLPRGTRLVYYFKGVDINGGATYEFANSIGVPEEIEPIAPGSGIGAIIRALLCFEVLPRVYPAGSPGSTLAGRTDSPILNLEGAYSAWGDRVDPVTQALVGMGVRADRYRLLQGLGEGNNIGGHELPGQRQDRSSNYFPNTYEYGIQSLLAASYRIIIQSSNLRTWPVFDEQDAKLVHDWWNTDTGTNGGDRCIFLSGDDAFNGLLNLSASFPQSAEQVSLATNVFGVSSCVSAWSSAYSSPYPTVDDRFAGGGPGMAAPGSFTYPVDGGCPGPNRFDGLFKAGSSDAQNAAIYPGGVADVAAVARMSENDPVGDNDRSKAVGYGFSIQAIRKVGFPRTAQNYVHTGIENRMQVLFKFLTSCRGDRGAATGQCWPCPGNTADLMSNWATATGFQTSTYGPLYPIQDPNLATGVADPVIGSVPFVNALSQNRPNPFNPQTTIPYSINAAGRTVIRIYNVAGQCVRTLVDAKQTAGMHAARWDGQSDSGGRASNGIYFYRITYPDGTTSARKMTILR